MFFQKWNQRIILNRATCVKSEISLKVYKLHRFPYLSVQVNHKYRMLHTKLKFNFTFIY